MGCDIYIVLEHFDEENEVWVGLRQLTYMSKVALSGLAADRTSGPYIGWRLTERHYDFFYALAGVRGGEGPHRDPLGLPKDMSSLSRYAFDDDPDLHSHSWIGVRDLMPIIERVKEGMTVPTQVANKLERSSLNLDLLSRWIGEDIEESDIHKWRIVFAFDN